MAFELHGQQQQQQQQHQPSKDHKKSSGKNDSLRDKFENYNHQAERQHSDPKVLASGYQGGASSLQTLSYNGNLSNNLNNQSGLSRPDKLPANIEKKEQLKEKFDEIARRWE